MEKYLGSGLAADVYLVKRKDGPLAKKVFNPSAAARIAYALIYQSRHPYLNPDAIHAAYWRRRIASRISRMTSRDVYVVDAVEECKNGFYCPFISGRNPTEADRKKVRAELRPFERSFVRKGLPVWSFGDTLNWRWLDNVKIDEKDRIAIIDYESGLPSPHRTLLVYFDDVDMKRLKKYCRDYADVMPDLLGKRGTSELEEAVENYGMHLKRWKAAENPVLLNALRGITSLARDTFFGERYRRREDDRYMRLLSLCPETIIDSDESGNLSVIGYIGNRKVVIPLSKNEQVRLEELVQEKLRRDLARSRRSMMRNMGKA